ncbi:hypothetical protein ACFY1A_17050 [Streptomyces sp. NPDC001520]|uniref:hypothetical protein n=1 Tax=unclassified Streptomyces TaxID=2593676 RepID=UPI0036A1A5FB
MAKLKTIGTVDVELSFPELELVRRALRLVENFGNVNDWDEARDLLADLEEVR